MCIQETVAALLPDLLQQVIKQLSESQGDSTQGLHGSTTTSAAVNQQPRQETQSGPSHTAPDYVTTHHRQAFAGLSGEEFLPTQPQARPLTPMMTRVPSPVFRHVQTIMGKDFKESNLSDEEQDSLSFTLSQDEVLNVSLQEFVDFSAIFRWHQQAPYGIGDLLGVGGGKQDMSMKEWAHIFMVFQAEHTHWHPKEATALLCY